MRNLTLALMGTALAACSDTPPASVGNDPSSQQLATMLAGKVAGPPQDCLPSYQSNNAALITAQAIVFSPTPNQVYVNNIAGSGCEGLANPSYTLITTARGPGGLCRGDVVKIVDSQVGTMVGSCALNSFVPYTGP